VYIDATFSVLNENVYAQTYIVLVWVWGGNLFDGNEVGFS